MVTLNMNTDLTSAAAYEWRGKSTDVKPIQTEDKKIPNSSAFFEMDTGDVYFWDTDTQSWVIPS